MQEFKRWAEMFWLWGLLVAFIINAMLCRVVEFFKDRLR